MKLPNERDEEEERKKQYLSKYSMVCGKNQFKWMRKRLGIVIAQTTMTIKKKFHHLNWGQNSNSSRSKKNAYQVLWNANRLCSLKQPEYIWRDVYAYMRKCTCVCVCGVRLFLFCVEIHSAKTTVVYFYRFAIETQTTVHNGIPDPNISTPPTTTNILFSPVTLLLAPRITSAIRHYLTTITIATRRNVYEVLSRRVLQPSAVSNEWRKNRNVYVCTMFIFILRIAPNIYIFVHISYIHIYIYLGRYGISNTWHTKCDSDGISITIDNDTHRVREGEEESTPKSWTRLMALYTMYLYQVCIYTIALHTYTMYKYIVSVLFSF